MRKGDIIANGWASEKNPHYLSMYIGIGTTNSMKTINSLCSDGKIIHLIKEDNKIEVVGHIDEYDAFIKALRKLDKTKSEGN